LEQAIVANLQSLFPGMEIIEAHPFHVTRDADSAIQELEAAISWSRLRRVSGSAVLRT
jgi:polyphosphate kinase